MDFNMTFPHIRYLGTIDNKGTELQYMKYIGKETSLITNGKVYEFYYCRYSPNRETPYREILVSKNDVDKYIRYEDEKENWVKS